MDKMKWFSRSQPDAPDDDRPPKRMFLPAGARLATITEGSPDGLGRQNRSSRLSFQKHSSLLGLPSENSQSYTTIWSDGKATSDHDSSRLSSWKEKTALVTRGGWKRLAAVLFIAIIFILALVLGLVFGLRNNDKSSSSSASSSDSSPSSGTSESSSADQKFPAGTYTFSTFLSTVQTDCTSNNATWRCRPYTTFAEDPTKSDAVFNWKITASGDSYTISSTDPLSVVFENEPLQLEGKGTDSERYTFQMQEDKKVVPTTNLTSDDAATTCFFNGTIFQASLYTKRAKNYPPKGLELSTKPSYDVWPYAVRIEEVAASTGGGPNCYKTVNGAITGDPIKSSKRKSASSDGLCDCLYLNYFAGDS